MTKQTIDIDITSIPSVAKKFLWWIGVVALVIIVISSVLVIIPAGKVGVDYTAWGGVRMDSVRHPGWSFKLPVLQTIYLVQTARTTINMYGTTEECEKDFSCNDVAIQVPSREGLLITLDLSLLFRVKPEAAPRIIQEFTPNFIDGTVMPEIRSVAREVTGTMTITEMYGAGRERLQQEMSGKLQKLFEKDGFVLEQVLVRDIQYPEQIRKSIEEKQAAEQVSFKKQFEIDIAEKEAKRKKLEGEGIANQKIAIAKGDAEALKLVSQAIKENPEVLKFKQIEVLQNLYTNPNVKFVALPSNQMILPLDLKVGEEK